MISKIEVCDAATFDGSVQTIDGLKRVNYFWGANGSGKTTISRIIEDQGSFPRCSVTWVDGTPLEVRVYNCDFVEKNLGTEQLPGIFTLGAQEAATLQKIADTKKAINDLMTEIRTLSKTLGGDDGESGKTGELVSLTGQYRERFWGEKRKYDEVFRGVLGAYSRSKEKFMTELLSQADKNEAELGHESDLKERAKKLFSGQLSIAQPIPIPSAERFLECESRQVLKKRVIGKADVDIAAIIQKLGNSDWVSQGRQFYERNQGICPFCQQKVSSGFEESLNSYFDETFERDIADIDSLIATYIEESQRYQTAIQELIGSESSFMDIESLRNEKALLDAIITSNLRLLQQKKEEPSRIVALESQTSVTANITSLLEQANAKIVDNNRTVNNLAKEQRVLTDEIWRFLVENLKLDLAAYKNQSQNLQKAIDGLSKKVELKSSEKAKKEDELSALERQSTSIQPTLDGINAILSSFGFRSFKLAKGADNRTYRLVRENGSHVGKTLSEGERNFVTFLYFYHLLKGSQQESGATQDRVVVFDDPVSSLDNDVLFIVSTLIRRLSDEIRGGNSNIKQLIVLTHNIYFHKEVSFDTTRGSGLHHDETFWLVKKNGSTSYLAKQTCDPVKSTYEMLWHEVKSSQHNPATIQNTLRRILEQYFRLVGGIRLNDLYKEFEGLEVITCKSLCSWVNAGSHGQFEDYSLGPLDESGIARYLVIFRQIFEKTNHVSHYNMMMGIEA